MANPKNMFDREQWRWVRPPRLEEVQCLMLPAGHEVGRVPDGWRAWSVPDRTFNLGRLDEIIEGLARQRTLRSRQELSALGIVCPYFAIRDAAVVGFAAGLKEDKRRQSVSGVIRASRADMGTAGSISQKLQYRGRSFLTDTLVPEDPRLLRSDEEPWLAVLREHDQERNRLRMRANAFRDSAKLRLGRPAMHSKEDGFEQAFLLYQIDVWTRLTGVRPSLKGTCAFYEVQALIFDVIGKPFRPATVRAILEKMKRQSNGFGIDDVSGQSGVLVPAASFPVVRAACSRADSPDRPSLASDLRYVSSVARLVDSVTPMIKTINAIDRLVSGLRMPSARSLALAVTGGSISDARPSQSTLDAYASAYEKSDWARADRARQDAELALACGRVIDLADTSPSDLVRRQL